MSVLVLGLDKPVQGLEDEGKEEAKERLREKKATKKKEETET